MTLRRPSRPQLRTRVLAGVLLITVVALVAFDVAAVTALRRYLLSQTDSRLQTVLSLYRPVSRPVPVRMRSQAPPPASAIAGERLAAPAEVRQSWVIDGPRLKLAPPALAQYYVGLVTVRGRPHSPAVGAFVREAMRTQWMGQPALAVRQEAARGNADEKADALD